MSLRYRCGRLTAACALALFADGAQAATNYYWTGAADSAWANVANWQTDGASGRVAATMPPGVITNGTGEVVYNNPEGCAVFGPVADGAPTKIDVSGTKEVKYIRFAGATAPSYELGLDATSAGARSRWTWGATDRCPSRFARPISMTRRASCVSAAARSRQRSTMSSSARTARASSNWARPGATRRMPS